MKARRVFLAIALCLMGTAVAYAQGPFMGTWKLNEAKTKYAAGATKLQTVTYEAAGQNLKVTVDGTDPSGNAVHWEWTGKIDGKPYPVTGNPTADMQSFRKINNRTVIVRQIKDGKLTAIGRITISPNGKSRTVTSTQIGPKGQRIRSVAVYDKE